MYVWHNGTGGAGNFFPWVRDISLVSKKNKKTVQPGNVVPRAGISITCGWSSLKFFSCIKNEETRTRIAQTSLDLSSFNHQVLTLDGGFSFSYSSVNFDLVLSTTFERIVPLKQVLFSSSLPNPS